MTIEYKISDCSSDCFEIEVALASKGLYGYWTSAHIPWTVGLSPVGKPTIVVQTFRNGPAIFDPSLRAAK